MREVQLLKGDQAWHICMLWDPTGLSMEPKKGATVYRQGPQFC